MLEWAATSFSKGSSWPRDRTVSPVLQADCLLQGHQESPLLSEATAKFKELVCCWKDSPLTCPGQPNFGGNKILKLKKMYVLNFKL